MVKVRLKCTGARNALCYRIVVMDSRSSRDGRAIEELGFYDPRRKEEKINMERFSYWKGVGAEISDTVAAVAVRAEKGILLKDRVKAVKPSKKAVAKAAAEAKAKADAAVAAEAEAKAAAEAAAAAAAEATEATEAAPEADA